METFTTPIPPELGTKAEIFEDIADAHNYEQNCKVQQVDEDGDYIFDYRKDREGNPITEIITYQVDEETGQAVLDDDGNRIVESTIPTEKDVPVMRKLSKEEYGKIVVMQHLNKLVQFSKKRKHERSVGKYQEVSVNIPQITLVDMID